MMNLTCKVLMTIGRTKYTIMIPMKMKPMVKPVSGVVQADIQGETSKVANAATAASAQVTVIMNHYYNTQTIGCMSQTDTRLWPIFCLLAYLELVLMPHTQPIDIEDLFACPIQHYA